MAAESISSSPASLNIRQWGLVALGALAFGLAHTQAPLYYSNQNQYFLHGLAQGGAGFLNDDWLANTIDPTPVFTACVAFTYRHLNVFVFYVAYFLILGVYFVSLLSIGQLFLPRSPHREWALVSLGALLIVLHGAALRLISVRLANVDYPWYLQCGVAGQYILGPGLQPSVFGVLLLGSIAAFANGRLPLAAVGNGAACWFHATYILPAAILTVAYMLSLAAARRWVPAVLLGVATLVLVLPTVIMTAATFGPTDAETFAAAQKVVAQMRIPHHTVARRWLDSIAGTQIAMIVVAAILARGTRLGQVLAISFLIGLALSAAQVLSGSLTLALLFPWRISSVLVPVATCTIVAWCVGRLSPRRWVAVCAGIVAVAVVGGGIYIQSAGLAYEVNQSERPALEYVREHRQSGDTYLIPVRIPGEGPRGSISTSFTPTPQNQQQHLISVDLQRFRLFTETPIYVDFKAIPYKDREVLEWQQRLCNSRDWYSQPDWANAERRYALFREGITHVLIPADRPIEAAGYEMIYHDAAYRIYRIEKPDH